MIERWKMGPLNNGWVFETKCFRCFRATDWWVEITGQVWCGEHHIAHRTAQKCVRPIRRHRCDGRIRPLPASLSYQHVRYLLSKTVLWLFKKRFSFPVHNTLARVSNRWMPKCGTRWWNEWKMNGNNTLKLVVVFHFTDTRNGRCIF